MGWPFRVVAAAQDLAAAPGGMAQAVQGLMDFRPEFPSNVRSLASFGPSEPLVGLVTTPNAGNGRPGILTQGQMDFMNQFRAGGPAGPGTAVDAVVSNRVFQSQLTQLLMTPRSGPRGYAGGPGQPAGSVPLPGRRAPAPPTPQQLLRQQLGQQPATIVGAPAMLPANPVPPLAQADRLQILIAASLRNGGNGLIPNPADPRSLHGLRINPLLLTPAEVQRLRQLNAAAAAAAAARPPRLRGADVDPNVRAFNRIMRQMAGAAITYEMAEGDLMFVGPEHLPYLSTLEVLPAPPPPPTYVGPIPYQPPVGPPRPSPSPFAPEDPGDPDGWQDWGDPNEITPADQAAYGGSGGGTGGSAAGSVISS